MRSSCHGLLDTKMSSFSIIPIYVAAYSDEPIRMILTMRLLHLNLCLALCLLGFIIIHITKKKTNPGFKKCYNSGLLKKFMTLIQFMVWRGRCLQVHRLHFQLTQVLLILLRIFQVHLQNEILLLITSRYYEMFFFSQD